MTSTRRFFLALALSLATCAARRSAVAPPEIVVRAAEQGATDRKGAIKALEDYLAGTPDPAVAPWAMVWAGEERRLNGESARARTWFEKVAESFPTHALKDAAVLGMAVVDADTSLSGNTLATLQLIADEHAPATLNADRYRLLARVTADEGSSPGQARGYAKKALDYASGDPSVLARVRRTVGDLIKDGGGPAAAPTDADAFEQIRAAMQLHDLKGVIAQAEAFALAFPDSPLAPNAAALHRRAAAGDPATAGRVGVLLPLSGEYAVPGSHLKEAISLANDAEGSPLDLQFVDTAGDPAKATAALDDLLLKKGCVAFIGPLLKPEVQAVSDAAERYEVPLIGLSQSANPATVRGGGSADSAYVFNGALTVDQQVSALLDEAMTRRALQNFAVLYPKNSYGENAKDIFVASVTARGGTAKHVVSYDPEAKSFLDVARLLGQQDDKARAGELYRLRRAAEAAGQDPSKVTVPPVIEFQAIFIPDNPRRSSLVASALAFEEYPIGTFRPHRDDVPVLLLGLNGWNSPDLVAVGSRYLYGALFVDAFTEDDPAAGAFIDRFQGALDRKPMVLEATAYDTTRLVAEAVQQGGADRAAVRDALNRVQIKAPVARGSQFGAGGAVNRELYVLTLTSKGIVQAPDPNALPPELDPP